MAEARRLSHLDARGRARMVDVGDKPVTRREAVARGAITMSAAASRMIRRGEVAKGDPLQAARLAGIMADWSIFRSLIIGGVGMAATMLAFWLAAPHGWAALPVVFLITTLGSVLVVNLQLRLMDVAGDAQTLGAAMNHASLNIANALGAWLGGLVIAAGWGLRAPALVGLGLSIAGVAILLLSAALHVRGRDVVRT